MKGTSCWFLAGVGTLGLVLGTGWLSAEQGGRGAPPPGSFQRPPQLPFPTEAREFTASGVRFRVVPVVSGLDTPWSLAFLPDGDMLVTERPGRLRIVRGGVLDPTPIAGTPDVRAMGQGGLFEVALHPQYATNQFIYLTYAKPGEGGAATALARGRFDGRTLSDVKDILVSQTWGTAGQHFGGKIAFGADGMLYLTTGDRGSRDRAQDLSDHAGTVLRLRDDGTVPPDNPFVNRQGARPEIYSYGHRNGQSLAFRPGTDELWQTEHGPQGGDELNLILPGRNYGWPIATFGREYSGEIISPNPWNEEVQPPATIWTPSIGTSGMAFYTGDAFPAWQGNLFVGGLSGMTINRLGINEKGMPGRETLLFELGQRVRDVRQGPDGLLYVVTNSNPSGILRIEPIDD
jgi:aldose sugar dehydrogenase